MKIIRWLVKQLLKLYYKHTKFLAFSIDCEDGKIFLIESQEYSNDIARQGTSYSHTCEVTPEDAMTLMLTDNFEKSFYYDPETRKFFVTYTLKTPSQNTNHNEQERSDAQ